MAAPPAAAAAPVATADAHMGLVQATVVATTVAVRPLKKSCPHQKVNPKNTA